VLELRDGTQVLELIALFAAGAAAQQPETDVRAGTSARMAAIHFNLQPEAPSELSTATR
jgi:hypothetical protein